MLCTVSGYLKDPGGAVLPSMALTIARSPAKGVAQDSAVMVPRLLSAATDATGRLSVPLYAGVYTVLDNLQRARFVMIVPEAATAHLHDCVAASETIPWPEAVQTAIEARDEALAAIAAMAQMSFADRAAAVAWAADANPSRGDVIHASGMLYRYETVATAIIPDMTGWVADGDPHWDHWGADPTGVVDSTALILAANTWAMYNGGYMRIGRGTYAVSGTLVDYDLVRDAGDPNLTLEGYGPGVSHMMVTGDVEAFLFRVLGDLAPTDSTGSMRTNNWYFYNFSFEGDDISEQNGFFLGRIGYFAIENVRSYKMRGNSTKILDGWEGHVDMRSLRCGNSFRIPIDGIVSAPEASETITGSISGATAYVLKSEAVSGVWYCFVTDIVGTFVDNETLTSTTGYCVANIPTGILGKEQFVHHLEGVDPDHGGCNNILFTKDCQVNNVALQGVLFGRGTHKCTFQGKIHQDQQRNFRSSALVIRDAFQNQVGFGCNLAWDDWYAITIEGTDISADENVISGGHLNTGVLLKGQTRRNMIIGNSGDVGPTVTVDGEQKQYFVYIEAGGADNIVHSNGFSPGEEVYWETEAGVDKRQHVPIHVGKEAPVDGFNEDAVIHGYSLGEKRVAVLESDQSQTRLQIKTSTSTNPVEIGARGNEMNLYTGAIGQTLAPTITLLEGGDVKIPKVGASLMMTDSAGTVYALLAQVGAPPTWAGVPVVTTTSAQTLTGKALSLGSNTVTATKAQINAAVTDGDVVFVGDTLPFLLPPAGEYIMPTDGAGGALSTLPGVADRMDIWQWHCTRTVTIDAMACNCTVGVASALADFVAYDSDVNGRHNALLFETAAVDLSTTGVKTAAQGYTFTAGRCYWLGMRYSSTATLSNFSSAAVPDINGGSPSTAQRKIIRKTLAYATPATNPLPWVSADIGNNAPVAIWLRVA